MGEKKSIKGALRAAVMDVPILWDCLYKVWLIDIKQLLLDKLSWQTRK